MRSVTMARPGWTSGPTATSRHFPYTTLFRSLRRAMPVHKERKGQLEQQALKVHREQPGYREQQEPQVLKGRPDFKERRVSKDHKGTPDLKGHRDRKAPRD